MLYSMQRPWFHPSRNRRKRGMELQAATASRVNLPFAGFHWRLARWSVAHAPFQLSTCPALSTMGEFCCSQHVLYCTVLYCKTFFPVVLLCCHATDVLDKY